MTQEHRPKEEEISRLRAQVRVLARACVFYAKGNHYIGFGEAEFEAPDEPNWLCPTTELPTEEQWEQLLLEDGGVAAAALRKAFGRKLTKYDHHTSRGRAAALVCSHGLIAAQCYRCHPERMPI